ncbi:MAG TPA: hypothetical protein VMU08_04005, partial [Rhizomicrobium sp.]|nr:hypothetical protein [Rhizomicrobium sp.]
MERWRNEAERYLQRVAELQGKLDALEEHCGLLPPAPLSYTPTEIGLLKHQLCILVISCSRSARQLLESIHTLWLAGHFVSASLAIRPLIELSGLLAFARNKVLAKLENPEDLIACKERVARLLVGSKSRVLLPSGDQNKIDVINVM